MTDLRTAAQQALEALERADKISGYANNKKVITALRAALAQKHDPVAHSGWVLREVLFDNGEPIGHREPQHSPAALAQQAEQQPMHPELQKMWEDHIDKCFRAIPVPEQAEPVVRGAAYADALRWTIKACGAVQRHDGVWFGDDAAARLARVLSEGIATPQQAEAVEPVAWANIDSDRLRVDPATGNVSIGAQQAEPTPPDATAGLVDDLCLLHLGWKSGADGDLYRAATDRVIARAGKVRGLRKIEQLGGYDDE